MSDHDPELHTDCDHFEDWLLESAPEHDSESAISPWQGHLESCAGCREQWAAHQMLIATFAGETVPDLSPAFQAGLDFKLEAAIRIEPLKGWRLAAMAGYSLLAVLLMSWIFKKFPLPTIDLSSPWTTLLVLVAVPLSLWLTAAATRLLPSQRPKGARLFAL